jgi:hypothetical protein
MDDKSLQRLMASLGHISIQWALLEAILAHAIWALLILDYETGAIVTGGTDMLPRVNMAILLARHKKAPQSAIRKLESVRSALQNDLLDRRNQAIHGIHADAADADKVKLVMLRWKHPKREQERSIADLDQISQDIRACQKDAEIALDIIWKWQLRPSPGIPS